MMSTKVTQ